MIRHLCAVFAIVGLAIPVASQAQPVSGFYVGGEGGLALPQQQNLDAANATQLADFVWRVYEARSQ